MSEESVKAAMLAAIDRIKTQPAMAKLAFKAETAWVEDVRCVAKVRSFPEITIDEPPELGGSDAGPNPVEAVLVALGTCQEIVYGAYAAVMGIPLDSVSCKLRGNIDLHGLFGLAPDVPPGFTRISFETTLESPADEESLQRLIRTVEAHCPVLDTIRRPVEVTGKVRVNGKVAEMAAAE